MVPLTKSCPFFWCHAGFEFVLFVLFICIFGYLHLLKSLCNLLFSQLLRKTMTDGDGNDCGDAAAAALALSAQMRISSESSCLYFFTHKETPPSLALTGAYCPRPGPGTPINGPSYHYACLPILLFTPKENLLSLYAFKKKSGPSIWIPPLFTFFCCCSYYSFIKIIFSFAIFYSSRLQHSLQDKGGREEKKRFSSRQVGMFKAFPSFLSPENCCYYIYYVLWDVITFQAIVPICHPIPLPLPRGNDNTFFAVIFPLFLPVAGKKCICIAKHFSSHYWLRMHKKCIIAASLLPSPLSTCHLLFSCCICTLVQEPERGRRGGIDNTFVFIYLTLAVICLHILY